MTTNKAFINAYRPQATVGTQSGDAESAFVTSQYVSAASTATRDQPATRTTARPQPRRPLSQVQAEELFGVTVTKETKQSVQWPERCQQLLASAADRYDSVLRKLPSTSTGIIVGIVGMSPQSACTTTAICLALRSAALGHRTTLVDGNLPQAGLATALQFDRFVSWSDVLATGASITTALVEAPEVGVDLLLAKPSKPTELDLTVRFRASLAAGLLRRSYERTIIDLGCVTGNGATGTNASHVGELSAAMGIDYLIATAIPSTTPGHLAFAQQQLDLHGLKLAGVIEAA